MSFIGCLFNRFHPRLSPYYVWVFDLINFWQWSLQVVGFLRFPFTRFSRSIQPLAKGFHSKMSQHVDLLSDLVLFWRTCSLFLRCHECWLTGSYAYQTFHLIIIYLIGPNASNQDGNFHFKGWLSIQALFSFSKLLPIAFSYLPISEPSS